MRPYHRQGKPEMLYLHLVKSRMFNGFPGFPVGMATIGQTFPKGLDPALRREISPVCLFIIFVRV